MSSSAYIRILVQVVAIATLWTPSATLDAATSEAIPPFDATYSVRYGILRGKMTLQLSHNDAGYLYQTSLSPRGMASWIRTGTIVERTELETANGSVRPLNYVSTDKIARPARNTYYKFGKKSGRVTGQYKAQSIDVPMRAGGQNRISAQVAMMMALKSRTELSRFPIFDRGRWKEYEFGIAGEQVVKTPAGRFDTVEIRYASADNAKSWSLYCATSHSYLPVMIVYRESGKIKSRAELTDYRIGSFN